MTYNENAPTDVGADRYRKHWCYWLSCIFCEALMLEPLQFLILHICSINRQSVLQMSAGAQEKASGAEQCEG